ncbi:MAG: endolytic transglycosylase MltG [Patescibacteria group bacterium]|nr:endolytic transglycosylase MltG [Patescibacteria group bacterium]
MPKKIQPLIPIFSVFLTIISLVALLFYLQTKPVDINDKSIKKIAIAKGTSVEKIGQTLKQENLIKQPLVFKLLVKYKNIQNELQAGSFDLSPSMNLNQIILTLTEGTDDVWVTLQEGLRREEIATSLENYDLEAYDKDKFLDLTVGLEGKLFPETYLMPRMITTKAVINLLTDTFDDKIDQDLADQINNSEYTSNEILTMASILEREARGYEQMAQVSGVLWKRFNMGMALQVDASLQYAAGYSEENQSWWAHPKAKDKEINSLFNTYQSPGLPPYPICSPGLYAIKAALNPVDNNQLFYLHDREGRIHFASNLSQHNQNISQYLR